MENSKDFIKDQIALIPQDTSKIDLPRRLDYILQQLADLDEATAEAYLSGEMKRYFSLSSKEVGIYRKLVNGYRKDAIKKVKSQKKYVDEERQENIQQEEPVDTSQFSPISATDLIEILGQTIKKDEENKLIAFLAQLSAYTEDSQINISFNAPSSSGKSFIPMEIAGLFPKRDVLEIGYCSPTAFFHQAGEFSKGKQGYIVDLSRKILIFLDQPHTLLLQHLRPMLSHDKKEILLKITDKSQKSSLRTKNIFLIGYPVVIFCTAGLILDEQEATRFLLLSPEINQEKIREAIQEKIKKDADSSAYKASIEANPQRQLLKSRILAIKQANIQDIKIGNPELVKKMFFERAKTLKPRHQRDIGRITSLVKLFALINLWFRKNNKGVVISNDDDVREAYKIWDVIAESQELNLPPYVFNFYKDVIYVVYQEKNSKSDGGVKIGLSKQDIAQKHFEVYGRFIPDWQLRQQILPMLETAGLITQEADRMDKRRILIYPTTPLTISQDQNNSESEGGVNSPSKDITEEAVKTNYDDTPKTPCYVCGSRKFWKTMDGSINCFICHPPTSEKEVKEFIEV